jgi:hypothetical protein
MSTDENGDPVMYFIDWGDDSTEWTEFSDSGEQITLKHTWNKENNYLIKAKAKDINDAESELSEFEITIPRFREKINLWYECFLERFPILEKLLIFILKN